MSKTNQHLLLIIDSQKGIDEAAHWGGNRNNPTAEKNIAALLIAFRLNKLPIIHVQHCSTSPNSPLRPNQKGHEFKEMNLPQKGELIIQKTTTNAFIKTDLEKQIKKTGATTVVIVGFVTNNSVEATARMSGDLGFSTIVVADATATFDKKGFEDSYSSELVHDLALGNLQGEYATILYASDLLIQLIGDDEEEELEEDVEIKEAITLLTPAQIKDIAGDIHSGLKCYFNIKTHKILKLVDTDEMGGEGDEWQQEEIAELEEHFQDYHRIDKMRSRDAFEVMEAFAEQMPAPGLKRRLFMALNKRRPFRNFQNTVDDSDYRQAWFTFRDQRQIEWVERQIRRLEWSLKEEDER